MGYQLQKSAASLAHRAEPLERVGEVPPVGAFERGGKVYWYPLDDDLSSTDVLDQVIPYLDEWGITEDEFYGIEDLNDELGGVAVTTVEAIGESGIDLEIADSLRIQAQIVRTFVEARRMVDRWVEALSVDARAARQNQHDTMVWDMLTDPVKSKGQEILQEMIAGLPGEVSDALLGELRQHFEAAAYFGMNTGCSRNNLMYMY